MQRDLPHRREQKHYNSGCQHARFGPVLATAPEIAGIPYQLVPRHSDCKATEHRSAKRERQIPAEMHSDGQPEVVGAQQRVAEKDAEQAGIHVAEQRGTGIPGVHQAEKSARAQQRGDGSPAARKVLENESAELQFFGYGPAG